ncbi:fibrinogen C domain-containing protein 1-like [Homalodisca vitripennis]|uniref:fibrinogen C domain-containing protein 1-like n=1 Tax=Homalodisca vitripennis TaxID=197043 RepID=UPI001EEACDEB|nr:fibrinogen C domain-containing protein 1-like [Homalodisca vitripennis]KAG8291913.1 hypothetical protein J6590_049825 [Homalodisca vitripennis]
MCSRSILLASMLITSVLAIATTVEPQTTTPLPAQPERWDLMLQQILTYQVTQTQQLQSIQHRLTQLESGVTGKLSSMQNELRYLREGLQQLEWGGEAGGRLEGAVETLRQDLNSLRQSLEYRQSDQNQREEKDLLEGLDSRVGQISVRLRRMYSQVQELGRTVKSNMQAVAYNTSILAALMEGQTANHSERVVSCPKPLPALLPPSDNSTPPLPIDCWDTLRQGHNRSGIYQIQPSHYHQPFLAHCDMDTMGGGWTVFQSRVDGSTHFTRSWAEFEVGFGNMAAGEFWLGLGKLHLLTNARVNDLLVVLKDHNEDSAWAYYQQFAIGDADQDYTISLLGNYHGSAGDSLRGHAHKFSAEDRDNDHNEGISCASSGAWWYGDCQDPDIPSSNLNGLYLNGSLPQVFPPQGMLWTTWRGPSYSIPYTAMMVRPSADVYKQLPTHDDTT